MTAARKSKVFPSWTEALPRSEGRDHLGMQAPSISLYAQLIPQLTNVTKRVRYYSFYPWLCAHYATDIHNKDPRVWQSYVRKAEALLALSCYSVKEAPVNGIGGIDWAQRHWNENSSNAVIEYASAALPGEQGGYLKSSYGIFGQVYGSVLADIGILGVVEEHPVPVPSEHCGDMLADAFQKSVGEAGRSFLEALKEDSVKQKTLKKIGEAFHPEAIPPNSDELKLLEKVIMGDLRETEKGRSRRESLLLILYVSSILEKMPTPMELRWIFYSGRLEDGKRIKVPERLQKRLDEWQAYQANELGHISMEMFLWWLCRELPENPESVQSTIGRMVVKIMDILSIKSKTWKDLVEKVKPADNPQDRNHPYSEWSLVDKVFNLDDWAESAEAGLYLLAVLTKRWSSQGSPVHEIWAKSGLTGFNEELTVNGTIQFAENMGSIPLHEFLYKLIHRKVIEQHLFVALRKLYQGGKSTFLFQLMDGELKSTGDLGIDYTNPRLDSSISFLRDLYLLGDKGPTKRSMELLGRS